MTENEIKKLAKEARLPHLYGSDEPANFAQLLKFTNLVIRHERKRLDLCSECGSGDIGNRSQRNAAGELEVGWQECSDCGHQWGHG